MLPRKAFKKNSAMLMFCLALSACATQPWQEAEQRYQDWAKETGAVKVFSVHKQRTLDELGAFDFDRRFYIYETLDEIANKLEKSPKRTVLKKVRTNTFEKFPILELWDRDLDGQPDQFVYFHEKGNIHAFGFIFDLNKDGRVDYLVLNGGPMFTKELFYWMNYHWIDSNYDGKVDIKVNNAVNLETGKWPPKLGLTVWVYDSDFDGYIDKAEYLSEGIAKPVPEKEGILTVNWSLQDIRVAVGKDRLGDFETKILADVNAAMR